MGMGGSSLAPLAFQHSFDVSENGLRLIVLDTTDPATIRKIEREVDLSKTLFIVASRVPYDRRATLHSASIFTPAQKLLRQSGGRELYRYHRSGHARW